MESTDVQNIEADLAVELTITETTQEPISDDLTIRDEITPLLTRAEKPRFNIFAVSNRTKSREELIKVRETEVSSLTQFVMWVWSGSSYSGLMCMTVSSVIYFLMELVSGVISVQPIPLHETAFARCAIILISSYLWLRKSGQPLFGPANARSFLVMRAMAGYLSLFSFIYCIQNLPLSQAIVISFTTPIFASLAAVFIFHEKLRISELGGLVCSFFGVIFLFQQTLGGQPKSVDGSIKSPGGSHHVFAVLVGLCSSVTGGISFCLIKAATRASEHPVAPVFWFGLLASGAAGLCMFIFEAPMLPNISSAFSMLVIGILAFFAEVFLARGLQLENTAKVANVQYFEAFLSQLWGVTLSSLPPSFGRLFGCFLIVISFCVTMYIGPDRESE